MSRWNFELRTIETVATILYNSGPDFVGLEIVDARLRLLVRKGSNVVELVPEKNISDGKWHNVSISYSANNVEVLITKLLFRSFLNMKPYKYSCLWMIRCKLLVSLTAAAKLSS